MPRHGQVNARFARRCVLGHSLVWKFQDFRSRPVEVWLVSLLCEHNDPPYVRCIDWFRNEFAQSSRIVLVRSPASKDDPNIRRAILASRARDSPTDWWSVSCKG